MLLRRVKALKQAPFKAPKRSPPQFPYICQMRQKFLTFFAAVPLPTTLDKPAPPWYNYIIGLRKQYSDVEG
jgi:hypothetical protein